MKELLHQLRNIILFIWEWIISSFSKIKSSTKTIASNLYEVSASTAHSLPGLILLLFLTHNIPLLFLLVLVITTNVLVLGWYIRVLHRGILYLSKP